MKREKEQDTKRKYMRVTDQQRANLIHMVEATNLSISKASSLLGINYTNAMSIVRVYQREKRMEAIRPYKVEPNSM